MSTAASTLTAQSQHWARGLGLHAIKVLHSGGNPTEVARALATWTGNIRTLSRRAGRQLNLCLPGWVCDALGWQSGGRVVLKVTEEGDLIVRSARDQDLVGFARPVVEAADQIRALSRSATKLHHFETSCEECGNVFCAQGCRARFCPTCKQRRARAHSREYWHRKGKATPSYQRKLSTQTLSAVPATPGLR